MSSRATTGLDTRTEADILVTLAPLRGRVTMLAVSHQPALRKAADLTIELGDYMIVWTPADLNIRPLPHKEPV